jgi:hypothetical protein
MTAGRVANGKWSQLMVSLTQPQVQAQPRLRADRSARNNRHGFRIGVMPWGFTACHPRRRTIACCRVTSASARVARQVLTEMNSSLLFDTGQLTETGLRRIADGGLTASWALSWPEQQAAGVEPIVLQAYFGGSFHHPHLRGTTVHDWPLNVFSEEDAAAQLSVLRAIAASDLHNLVYRADYRIVPAVTTNPLPMAGKREANGPATNHG